MTAQPTSIEFAPSAVSQPISPVLTQPNVVERYWGYEVSQSGSEMDLAFVVRCLAALCLVGIGYCLFAGVALPVSLNADHRTTLQGVVTLVLMVWSVPLLRVISRSTRVRVQMDTSAGEIREVVSRLFGRDVVLSRYGLDAVKDIMITVSKQDPSHGQVLLTLKTGDTIAVGTGSLLAVRTLRDRIASDCGFARHCTLREAIWSGPLGTR